MTNHSYPTDRAAILDKAIRPYVLRGWLVQNRTDHSAQLLKPAAKKSCVLIVVLLLLGVLPGILYLLWPSRDRTLLIEVDVDGLVRVDGQAVSAPAMLAPGASLRSVALLAAVALALILLSLAIFLGPQLLRML